MHICVIENAICYIDLSLMTNNDNNYKKLLQVNVRPINKLKSETYQTTPKAPYPIGRSGCTS